jgi:hypothetical protein
LIRRGQYNRTSPRRFQDLWRGYVRKSMEIRQAG